MVSYEDIKGCFVVVARNKDNFYTDPNYHNKRLLSPLRGWDGLFAASRLQARPKAGR